MDVTGAAIFPSMSRYRYKKRLEVAELQRPHSPRITTERWTPALAGRLYNSWVLRLTQQKELKGI